MFKRVDGTLRRFMRATLFIIFLLAWPPRSILINTEANDNLIQHQQASITRKDQEFQSENKISFMDEQIQVHGSVTDPSSIRDFDANQIDGDKNKIFIISEASRLRTRPYDSTFNLSNTQVAGRRQIQDFYSPSMRHFYLLATEFNKPAKSNAKSDESSGNQSKSIRRIENEIPARVTLAPRVRLRLLQQNFKAQARQPARTKFFKLISSAHSPLLDQLIVKDPMDTVDSSRLESQVSQVSRLSAFEQPSQYMELNSIPMQPSADSSQTTRAPKSDSDAIQIPRPPSLITADSLAPTLPDDRLISSGIRILDDEEDEQQGDSTRPADVTVPLHEHHSLTNEIVKAARNNLTVLDPVRSSDERSHQLENLADLDDRRSQVISLSTSTELTNSSGLTQIIMVKGGSSANRPVAIMRRNPGISVGLSNSSSARPHLVIATETGQAKPPRTGLLVLKKEHKQRIMLALPPKQNSSSLLSSPQTIRLISKQRHKYDDRVVSPTLTVIDNDALRLPPNTTSVHNNKLIVTLRPGRPYRRQPQPPTTQFPVYNIVAGITPPYSTGHSHHQAQVTRAPPPRPNYGLISKPPGETSKPQTTPVPFRAPNIKFPAQVPSSLVHPAHEGEMSIIDKLNISVPANDPSMSTTLKRPPNKIQMETEEQIMRPPTETIVLSDTTVVSRPYGSSVSSHGGGIIKLSTTRRPKPSPTKRINIVSANTTVVTANPEEIHEALSVIAESHDPPGHNSHHNRPTNKPGIFDVLSGLLNTGLTTSTLAILALVKTIFISLFILFLPPIALSAAIIQAVSG